MKMRVILRTGTIIDVDVTEFTVCRNSVTGGLDELKWSYVGDETVTVKLKYLRPDDVAAVLAIYD
jgi:hypothetical protein